MQIGNSVVSRNSPSSYSQPSRPASQDTPAPPKDTFEKSQVNDPGIYRMDASTLAKLKGQTPKLAQKATNILPKGLGKGLKRTLGAVPVPFPKKRLQSLRDIDNGNMKPDPNSRLGAYAATKGYDKGTVGHAVHNAIGTIYTSMGTVGEEEIGKVFNSDEAKALYNKPVDGPAGLEIATMEHNYWKSMRSSNSKSVGGHLGSVFSPKVRDRLQRHIFS